MSTFARQLADALKINNDRYTSAVAQRDAEMQSYNAAYDAIKSGGGYGGLDDNARKYYNSIETELIKQQREAEEQAKKERESMNFFERAAHTIGDFGGQIASGIFKFGENIADFGATIFGAEDWAKKDYTQKIMLDPISKATKGSYLNDSKFGNMVQDAAFGFGNMLPSVVLPGFIPGLSAIPKLKKGISAGLFMANGAGAGTQEALQQGASRGKALLYGGLSGITEGAIESLSGGIGGLGKGVLQKVGRNTAKSTVAKGFKGNVKKYTGRMIGEGLEEVASDLVNPLLRFSYTGSVDYSDVSLGSLANTFGVGALAGGMMMGGQSAVNTVSAKHNVGAKLGEINEIKSNLDKRFYDGKLSAAQYAQSMDDIGYLRGKAVNKLNKVSDRRGGKVFDKFKDELGRYGVGKGENGYNAADMAVGGYNHEAMTPSLALHSKELKYAPTNDALNSEQKNLIKHYGKLNNGRTGIVFTDNIEVASSKSEARNMESAGKSVDGASDIQEANGGYADNVIYISKNAKNPVEEVLKHEFTHSLEGSKEYGDYAKFVLNEIGNSETLTRQFGSLDEIWDKVSNSYNDLAPDDVSILTEVVAKYSERLFSDPKAINRLARANKGLALRALGGISDKLRVLGHKDGQTSKFLHRAEQLYRKAMEPKAVKSKKNATQEQPQKNEKNAQKLGQTSQADSKFSIATRPDGKKYVKANRQIMTSNDLEKSRIEVVKYINDVIRKNKDLKIKTVEGDVLTLTNNTAGKGGYWNANLTSKDYKTKLNAEVHIDEIANVSIAKKNDDGTKFIVADKDNKHAKRKLAKDGWSYRTAYFEDYDGTMYKLGLSVAIDGSIESLYNIGKIKRSNRLWRTSPSGGYKTPAITSINSIPDKTAKVNHLAEKSPKSDKNIDKTKFSLSNTDKNTSQVDSDGNYLSAEQAQFFKNSKVRDTKGNLLKLYHGSGAEFNIFDITQSRSWDGVPNYDLPGFYFSESIEESGSYGKVKTFYVNVTKPYVGNVYDLASEKGSYRKAYEYLVAQGYDGMIIDESGEGFTEVLAFFPQQIKLTQNKQPTLKEDIRYSLNLDQKREHRKKTYTLDEVKKIVDDVLDKGVYGVNIEVESRQKIEHALHSQLNNENTNEGTAAMKAARAVVKTAYLRLYEPEAYERAQDVIEFYNSEIKGKFNLDTLSGDIKAELGRSAANIYKSMHNANGANVEQIGALRPRLKQLHIVVKSSDSVAKVITKIYRAYRKATVDEKGVKQLLSELKSSKRLHNIEQRMVKVFQNIFDNYGSKTKIYKEFEKLQQEVRNVKAENADTVERYRMRDSIFFQTEQLKRMKDKGLPSTVINDEITQSLLKTVSNIVTRGDINTARVVEMIKIMSAFYTLDRLNTDADLAVIQSLTELKNAIAADTFDMRKKNAFTTHDLMQIDKVVKGVRHYITHSDVIMRKGKAESAIATGRQGVEVLTNGKKLLEKHKVKAWILKVMRKSLPILDPSAAIALAETCDKNAVISSMLDEIKSGETNSKAMAITLMYPIDEFLDKNKPYVKRLQSKVKIGGVELEFNSALEVYLVSKRLQAQATLFGYNDAKGVYHQGGGLTYRDSNGNIHYLKVTKQDIEDFSNKLTEKDIEFIDALNETLSLSSDVKKQSDMEMLGYTNVIEGYYYPIYRADAWLPKKYADTRDYMSDMQNIHNFSFNKQTVRNAHNPIELRGVLETIGKHVKTLSTYSELTQPLKNFDKVMAVNINAHDNTLPVETLKSTLYKSLPQMEKYLRDLIQDVQGSQRQRTTPILTTVKDGYIKAVLGFNPKTYLSQLAGLPASMTYLKAKYIAHGMVMKFDRDTYNKYSKYGLAREHNKSAVYARGVTPGKKLGKVGDLLTKPIQMFDNAQMHAIWNACCLQVAAEQKLKFGSEEHMIKSAEYYEFVSRQTQSNDSMTEKSALMRSESEIARTVTMFMSDALKQYSRTIEHGAKWMLTSMRFKDGTATKEELVKARRQFIRTLSSFALSNAFYVAVGLLFSCFLRKKDDEGKNWDGDDYAKAFGMGMLDSYVGLFPIVRDIFGKMINGYDIGHFSYSMLNDLVDGAKGVIDLTTSAIKGEIVTHYDGIKALRNLFNSVMMSFGVPSKNIDKYVKMVIGWISPTAVHNMNSLLTPPKKSSLDIALEKKDETLAFNVLKTLMLDSRGSSDLSENALKDLFKLYKAGQDIVPSKVPDKVTWTDAGGESVEKVLSAKERAKYADIYAKAGKEVNKLIAQAQYKSLSKEQQAKAVMQVYKHFAAKAKASVTGQANMSKLNVLSSLLTPATAATVIAATSGIKADLDARGNPKSNSRRKKIVRQLTAMGVPFDKRDIILVLLGYSPSSEQLFKRRVRSANLSNEEKDYLLSLSS